MILYLIGELKYNNLCINMKIFEANIHIKKMLFYK